MIKLAFTFQFGYSPASSLHLNNVTHWNVTLKNLTTGDKMPDGECLLDGLLKVGGKGKEDGRENVFFVGCVHLNVSCHSSNHLFEPVRVDEWVSMGEHAHRAWNRYKKHSANNLGLVLLLPSDFCL